MYLWVNKEAMIVETPANSLWPIIVLNFIIVLFVASQIRAITAPIIKFFNQKKYV